MTSIADRYNLAALVDTHATTDVAWQPTWGVWGLTNTAPTIDPARIAAGLADRHACHLFVDQHGDTHVIVDGPCRFGRIASTPWKRNIVEPCHAPDDATIVDTAGLVLLIAGHPHIVDEATRRTTMAGVRWAVARISGMVAGWQPAHALTGRWPVPASIPNWHKGLHQQMFTWQRERPGGRPRAGGGGIDDRGVPTMHWPVVDTTAGDGGAWVLLADGTVVGGPAWHGDTVNPLDGLGALATLDDGVPVEIRAHSDGYDILHERATFRFSDGTGVRLSSP